VVSERTRKATFAAGCFWHVEAAFRELPGVLHTQVGYTGGSVAYPTYRLVCRDATGHAEAVEVDYDDGQLGYEDLLQRFFRVHDPTLRDRQGPDVGSQYRSAIFVHDGAQEAAARAAVAGEAVRLGRPVATQVERAHTFWRAEDRHQRYLERRGLAPAFA
jgi:peptide-methionine (S)-S-oxide reductase